MSELTSPAQPEPRRVALLMRRYWGISIVLAMALLLNGYHLDWGLPNDHSWSNDSISPHQPLGAPDVYWSGEAYKYPILQPWVGFVASVPVLAWWSAHGKYDFSCRSISRRCFPQYYEQVSTLILVHRLVTVLMSLGVLIAVHRLSMALFDDPLGATLTAAFVAGSYVFVQFSHLANVDIPALFWFTWSMLLYVKLLQSGATAHYVMFGLLAACALSTKESVVGAYLLAGPVILTHSVRAARLDRGPPRVPALKNVAWLLLALVLCYGTINNVWSNFDGYLGHLQHWLGGEGGVRRYWHADSGPSLVLAKLLSRLDIEVGWPFLTLSLCGLIYGLVHRRHEAGWLLLPAVSYALFLIFVIRFYNVRFGLPLLVLLAPFSGLIGARLLRLRPPFRYAGLALLTLIFVYGFLASIDANLLMANDSRYRAERWITENIDRSDSIGVFSFPEYLPRLGLLEYEPELVDMESIEQADPAIQLPDYLVMTSKYYSRLPRAFTEAMLAGQLGYRPVWSYHYRSPLGDLIGYRRPSRVNPRIVILRRAPSQ